MPRRILGLLSIIGLLRLGRAVPASAFRSAAPPRGDMAFATAVAAFGQKLRGDKYLGDYSFADARGLAGDARGYWRQQFVKLTELAATHAPVGAEGAN